MIRSIYLVIVYLSLLGMGCAAPFVLTLGYVWVDLFTPQAVAYFILNQIPCALIMGVAAFGGYLMMDRRSPPRFCAPIVLLIMLAVWCTITLLWAEMPAEAWEKWNWAFKTLIFSAFIPFAIRSRAQIEAYLLVYVFSLSANLIPFGAKTAISGGGYGRDLGLVAGNSGLSEGAFLATAAISSLPIIIYALNNSVLLPKTPIAKLAMTGIAAAAVLAAIGTYERTALIGLVVFGIGYFLKSKHKVLSLVVGLGVACALIYNTSGAWQQRMDTLQTYDQESSALTRLLVWKWTFDYSLTHPLGGGFEAYRIDRIEYPNGSVVIGRAFHSLYFELLGEQGWPGLAMYLAIAAITFINLRNVVRRTKDIPDLAWCNDLAKSLLVMLSVLLVCDSFIAVAFRGMNTYTFAIATSLTEYVRRVLGPAARYSQGNARSPLAGIAAMPGLRTGAMPPRA